MWRAKVKHKFKDYESCLKTTQLEYKINQLKKITLMKIILQKQIKNS